MVPARISDSLRVQRRASCRAVMRGTLSHVTSRTLLRPWKYLRKKADTHRHRHISQQSDHPSLSVHEAAGVSAYLRVGVPNHSRAAS